MQLARLRCQRSTAIKHLGRSILGSRFSGDCLFAMLTCYFDEAGAEDHKFIVVAGYVATLNQWDAFEIDWPLMLARYDVPYLHMKEISQFKGPFKKWKEQPGTRRRFLQTAAEIINATVRYGISVTVGWLEFQHVNAEYRLDEYFSSPYALAGRSCVAEANSHSRGRTRGPIDMEYVFERGGPDVAGLVRAVTVVTPELPIPIFKPSRDTKAERGLVPLQAADYLAYEIRKFVSDQPKYLTGERVPRGSLGALATSEIRRRFWNYERLITFCHRQGLKKRNLVMER